MSICEYVWCSICLHIRMSICVYARLPTWAYARRSDCPVSRSSWVSRLSRVTSASCRI